MTLERIFKNIVALYFLVYAYLIGLVLFFEEEAYIELPESDLAWPWLIVFVLLVITQYCLYTFKPIGKKLFLPLILIGILLMTGLPLESFHSDSVFEYLIDYIASICEGAILAMLYFTDIKKKFN